MNKLSFIIPVFNCVDYLLECVESIEKIGLADYEILLIDDGSTDGSGSLCDSIANTSKFVCCFHQSNAGVSVARNRGLEHVTGDYVWFIDADDQIESEKMKSVIEILERDDTIDMLIFGLSFDYYFDGRIYRRDDLFYIEEGLFGREYWLENFWNLYKCNSVSPVWNKCIRRRILTDYYIRFDSNLIEMEDFLFVVQCFKRCQQIYISRDVIYRYRQSEDECNTYRRLLKIKDLAAYMRPFACLVGELVSENVISQEVAVKIKSIVGQIYVGFLREIIRFGSIAEIKKTMENMISGQYSKYVKDIAPDIYFMAKKKRYVHLRLIGARIRVRHWIAVRVKYIVSLGVNR